MFASPCGFGDQWLSHAYASDYAWQPWLHSWRVLITRLCLHLSDSREIFGLFYAAVTVCVHTESFLSLLNAGL